MAEMYAFHVVRRRTSLSALGETLYDDAVNRTEFERLNAVALADAQGLLQAGQVLFLPNGSCHIHEREIMETVAEINYIVLHEMTLTERELLAEGYQLLDNIASNPENVKLHQPDGTVKVLFNYGNGFAGGGLAALSLEVRVVRQLLRNLEQEYHNARRNGGRLTPAFYARSRQILQTLDSRIGRVMRSLATQTPYHLTARKALRISHKRNLLHWQRGGETVRGFSRHFRNISSTAGVLRMGGVGVIGVDGMLTMHTIDEACRSGDEMFCAETRAVEGGGFLGRSAGGIAGGTVGAYAGCNLLFGAPSAGTSLLWCGLVGGFVGGVAGGGAGGLFGEARGRARFESRHPVRYEP
ncbi:MAG: hypothetical protein JJU06_15550 [Ectothiorhodospiraceae bacterium]|nr:hypothetical protein [Ectothiorhodospiraceae bacterium]